MRRHGVAFAVTSEKGETLATEAARHDVARRRPEGRLYLLPFRVFEPLERIEAAAADNGEIDGHRTQPFNA